jgi:uncharacterized protein YcbX
MSEARISALYEYPIKSGAANPIDSLEITKDGLRFDRNWMVIDMQGKFITQRRFPKMALVHSVQEGNQLAISTPENGNKVIIPLESRGRTRLADVHTTTCVGIDCGKLVAEFFSDYLGIDCKLLQMHPEFKRLKNCGRVRFADSYSLSTISEETVSDVNNRILANGHAPVDIIAFRPNIVVANCLPYEEDTWKQISVNGVQLELVKPYARCDITTVNQLTGEKNKDKTNEPLATLAQFRVDPAEGVVLAQKTTYLTTGTIRK